MALTNRAAYILWAGSSLFNQNGDCPFCENNQTHLVKRKALVTALYECPDCGLRFRVPKDDADALYRFYQTHYQQGFTTEMPSPVELQELVQNHFRGSPKDYAKYIQVLNALPLPKGASIFDFGCSWGYGSWQMHDAGFRVYSYEISQPRAEYAASQLNCTMLADPFTLPAQVDCFFSAHVLEHLAEPQQMWKVIHSVLKPDGIVVCVVPNGDPRREQIGDANYHKLWGQVHPLMVTQRFLEQSALRNGFQPLVLTSPFSPAQVARREAPGEMTGDELLLIARRA